jgi:hypothetical protein
MVFSPVIAMVCFKVLRWLCIVVSGLMLVLFLRQWLVDDMQPRPVHLLFGAGGFGIGAVVLYLAERWIRRSLGLR